ncbi:MAG TPA: hypothetical protein VE953_24715 [Terriglobales bacterium]|nr:hypothetical protein [Terriglobales bacterium]
MDDYDVRRRIRRAIDPGPGFPGPMLWERTVSRLDEPPEAPRRPWQIAVLAAVAILAAASVGVLLVSRSAVDSGELPAVARAPLAHLPPPTSTRPGTADYQFVSATAGWLVEYDGGVAHVLRTADGGAHWTVAGDLTGVDAFATLRFFDDHQGLVIGPAVTISTPGVRVYSTTDGGVHWHGEDAGADVGIVRSSWFASMAEGWLLTSATEDGSMSVFHTTDGGRGWSLLSGPATEPLLTGLLGQKGRIQFATSQDGWISTTRADPPVQVLLATRDGGRTWRAVDLPPPPGLNMTGKVLTGDLPMLSGQDGLLTAGLSSPRPRPSSLPANAAVGMPVEAVYLYQTHDGGRTWSFLRRLDQFGIGFEDATHWYRVGVTGVALSDDAGRTWGPVRPVPQPRGWYPQRTIFMGSNGWTVLQRPLATPNVPNAGMRYAVLRTTDGGAHWTEGELPPP